MSAKSNVRIRIHNGVVEFIGEIDNTTSTMMKIHENAKRMGISYKLEEEGFSLLPTTLCG